jgi:arsenate reductase
MSKPTKLRVLFLCTGNSCRSQMAEGWARELKSDTIDACSAGIETHGLNPNAINVMAEVGVDITSQKSELVSGYLESPIDLVITVCGHAHETCPVFPGSARVMHVPFNDPPALAQDASSEEEKLDCYRRVRDEIRAFIEKMPENILDQQ